MSFAAEYSLVLLIVFCLVGLGGMVNTLFCSVFMCFAGDVVCGQLCFRLGVRKLPRVGFVG